MKEQDVRQRIESILKMPAAVAALFVAGLVGLACTDPDCLVGCGSLVCVGGIQSNPDHCGCPVCAPLPTPDGGTVTDGGKTEAPPACPLLTCPALSCTRYESNAGDPCGCPICLPTPDAGVDTVAPHAGVDAEMIDGETD
jgi:hypothetical protein